MLNKISKFQNMIILSIILLIFQVQLSIAFKLGKPSHLQTATKLFSSNKLIKQIDPLLYEKDWKIIPDIWETLAKVIPNETMFIDEIHSGSNNLTFQQVNQEINNIAVTLQSQSYRLIAGECVSIFSENSYRWFVMEQAVMKVSYYYYYYYYFIERI